MQIKITDPRQAAFLLSATRSELATVRRERAPGWEERAGYLARLLDEIVTALRGEWS